MTAEKNHSSTTDLVRCYVCQEWVPKGRTALLRHRVPSGLVRTRSAYTYRVVRKCNPACGVETR